MALRWDIGKVTLPFASDGTFWPGSVSVNGVSYFCPVASAAAVLAVAADARRNDYPVIIMYEETKFPRQVAMIQSF